MSVLSVSDADEDWQSSDSDSASSPWRPVRVRPRQFQEEHLYNEAVVTGWRAAVLAPAFIEIWGSCSTSSIVLLYLNPYSWAVLVATGKAVHSRLFYKFYLES